MSSTDDFAATVGVLLLENVQAVPWQGPLPPALGPARGWYRPHAEGPSLLVVLEADAANAAALENAIYQWHAWLASLDAGESVLLLVWSEGFPTDQVPIPLDDGGLWQVWAVDVPGQRIEGWQQSDVEPEFLVQVGQATSAYLQGTRLTLADLEEQETASLEGKPRFSIFLRQQRAPATWALLALIGGFYLLTESLHGSPIYRLLRAGANFRPLVEQGEVWRLMTANFLHNGEMHLAVNAFSLFAVGPSLEKLFGTVKYLAIFLVAGLAGALASFAFLRDAPSAGASGALFGLIGAMLILGVLHAGAIPDHQRRAMRTIALVTLALNLGFGLLHPLSLWLGHGPVGPNVDNYAHLGGLAGGSLMAALLGPHPALLARRQPSWLPKALWAIPVLAALFLGVGLRYTFSGQVPEMRMVGPTDDYVVKLPLDLDFATTGQYLFATADNNQHWVEVTSGENWAGLPTPDRRALMEDSLENYADLLASRYATQGAKLASPTGIVSRGKHRFLRIPLFTREGAREEVFVTASAQRIYAIRTRGLLTQPWVRPTLERILATFEMKS